MTRDNLLFVISVVWFLGLCSVAAWRNRAVPRSWLGQSVVSSSGSLIRNVAPPPCRFSADIRPLCASTMVRAMDSPMPIPSALLVKNGSKISLSFSAGIPGPLSDIESSAKSSTRDVRMLMLRWACRPSRRLH